MFHAIEVYMAVTMTMTKYFDRDCDVTMIIPRHLSKAHDYLSAQLLALRGLGIPFSWSHYIVLSFVTLDLGPFHLLEKLNVRPGGVGLQFPWLSEINLESVFGDIKPEQTQ